MWRGRAPGATMFSELKLETTVGGSVSTTEKRVVRAVVVQRRIEKEVIKRSTEKICKRG
jgi:hypothetical protein